MSNASRAERTHAGRWPPPFQGGGWPPLAFVLAFALWVMVSNLLFVTLFGPDPGFVPEQLVSIVSSSVQIGIAVAFLRYEGVRLRDVGLATRLLVPAVVAVVGVVVVLNVAAAGLAAADGGLSVGFFALLRSPPQSLSLPGLFVGGVNAYLFVGPSEELAIRGYLQNKLVTLFGGRGDRVRTALAVVTAAVVFGLLHVPTLVVVQGRQPGAVVGMLVLLVLSGVTFGVVYEATHNLYLVVLLHGIGDFWPLFVDPGPGVWPNWGVVLVCYALLVLLYRRWATVPSTSAPERRDVTPDES